MFRIGLSICIISGPTRIEGSTSLLMIAAMSVERYDRFGKL
jgi:hypothetical protein